MASLAAMTVWGVSNWMGSRGECDLGYRPTFEDAAGDRRVVGVVERRVVASSVMPWGASVAVTTRVWGNRRVERWVVSKGRFSRCTFALAQPGGTMVYDFEAREGVTPPFFRWFPTPEPVDSATADRWRQAFGSETSFEFTRLDRVLAWLRVYPELFFLMPLGGLILWSRRQGSLDR